MLQALTTNECTIKDSFKFAEELQSFDSKLVIARIDIESHFTNFFFQEAINFCVEICLKIGLMLIICRKTLSVSYLLGLCLNH